MAPIASGKPAKGAKHPLHVSHLVKGLRLGVKGAAKMAREQKDLALRIQPQKDFPSEQELKERERLKRIEKFLRHVKAKEPERFERMQHFLNQVFERIEQWKQMGIGVARIEHEVQQYTEQFFENEYPVSKINSNRVRMTLRWFKAQGAFE